MKKLTNKLQNYKAKGDGTTIKEHNQDLLDILNQIHLPKCVREQMEKIVHYHDIGKVVGSFQEGITNKFREVRHEMLSASVVGLREEEMLAILTHHKTLDDIMGRFDIFEKEYLGELKEVEDKLGLKMQDITPKLNKYIREKGRGMLKNQKAIRLKGILNRCDHIGSSTMEYLESGKDMQKVYNFKEYTSVQTQAKMEKEDILIVSPTGSGKTEASLYWASNIDKEHKANIFYILPYIASINAMYERFNEKGLSVGMLHSKAAYTLYKETEDYRETKEKYQSYRYFTKNITITTTHQIFKAVFNCKFNEMLLSMFYGSTFILDEIHCYDEKDLALILSTLRYLKENYGIRVCIMSASIPKVLQEKIKEELGITRVLRLTDTELSEIKRHKVNYKEVFIEEEKEIIKEALKEGKRVIVCVNTIQKSIDMYQELKGVVGEDESVLINSYFNTRDRDKIETKLKDTKLLVGTQAIEVSLDINYDEMYTEVSPIDSQIQRWGRVNRKRTKDLKERKEIYIYNTESKIYKKGILERTKQLLRTLKEIDEGKVQEYLDSVYIDELEDYKRYKEIMETEILPEVQMAKWDSTGEKRFTGMSVLPISLEKEYKDLISNNKYYEANSLLVNIPIWVIEKAKTEDALVLEDFTKRNGDTQKEYVILYDYTSQIGLQIGKKQSNIF